MDGGLSVAELLSDSEPSSNSKLSFGDDPSSDGEISSTEGLILDEYELAPTYDVDDEVYENGEDDGVEDYEYDDYGFDDYEDNVDKNDEQEGPEYQQGEDDILQTCKTLWNNTSISAQTKAAREKGKLEERRGGKGKMQFNVAPC